MEKNRRLKALELNLREEAKLKKEFEKSFLKVNNDFDFFIITLPSGSCDLTDGIKKRSVA